MAKAFGILLLVLGVWLGMEIFTKGMDGAFGGVFAQLSGTAPGAPPAEPPMQKIRSRVTESMKATSARTSRGIGDPADEDVDMVDPSEVDPDSLDH